MYRTMYIVFYSSSGVFRSSRTFFFFWTAALPSYLFNGVFPSFSALCELSFVETNGIL